MKTQDWHYFEAYWQRLRKLTIDDLAKLADQAQNVSVRLSKEFEKARCRSFDAWAKQATLNGAGLAHKWT
eukprot:4153377-Pyramimonas_sp.AAC.1